MTVMLDGCVSNRCLLSFQECMSLIRRLCVEEGAGAELINKLTENLKEILSDNKVRADTPDH